MAGTSATIASVVTSSPATDTAPCSAVRTTLVGSMTPALNMLTYSAFWASKPKLTSFWSSMLARDHRAVEAGILGDLAHRRLQGAAHDLDADLLVMVGTVLVLEHAGGIEQGRAAAGDDAFLDRGLGRMHGVLDPVLAFLDLDLGGAADLDDGHAAGQLGQPLLQLLAVIVGAASPRPAP